MYACVCVCVCVRERERERERFRTRLDPADFVDQSHTGKTDSSWAGQEIPYIFWNPKFVAVLRMTHNLFLSWATWIQITP